MHHLANAQLDWPAGGNTGDFFCRFAGQSVPTGLAIVHSIGY